VRPRRHAVCEEVAALHELVHHQRAKHSVDVHGSAARPGLDARRQLAGCQHPPHQSKGQGVAEAPRARQDGAAGSAWSLRA
jgi:hypothetical protein